MSSPLVLVHGFDRPNIRLEVLRHHEDTDKRRAVLQQVTELVLGGRLVMGHDDDLLTVLFDREGYRTLSRKAVLGHGLLTRA